jgi:LysM repeat protein
MRPRPLLLCAVLAFVLAFVLAAASAWARPSVYTVRRGDTLTSIAKRYDVKVSELRRWNRLRKDRIRPGDKLNLRPTKRQYRIRKGETLSRIAKREAVSIKDIVRLNPGLNPRKIRAGQIIELPGAAPERKTAKRDEPARRSAKRKAKNVGTTDVRVIECPGRLARVPAHVGYKRVHRHAAWATAKTNDALKRGFNHVLRRHRLAPRVHVLDASRRDLGPAGDHRSHQSGRDVDITYYQKKCPRSGCPTRRVRPSQLDARRQWTLLHYWLTRGDVEMVFIGQSLQRVLREYAKKKGVPERQLDVWFQYPRPAGSQEGIIRHWSGHENHIHVRFRGPSGTRRCPKR